MLRNTTKSNKDTKARKFEIKLTTEFGKGFTVRNLQMMRQFYLKFPNANALRSELSWTHYRSLMRVEDEVARRFYLEEAVKCSWSSGKGQTV